MKIDSFKIKLLMAEKEINHTELSERCGISRQNLNVLLKRGSCSVVTVGRLAKALGVPVREIARED